MLFILENEYDKGNNYLTVPSSLVKKTRRPFCSRAAGNMARQELICDLMRGMLGCALWHLNSIDRKLSSLFDMTLPYSLISCITFTGSQKNGALNAFQCFLFLRCFESKSWLCHIQGAYKKRQFISSNGSWTIHYLQ